MNEMSKLSKLRSLKSPKATPVLSKSEALEAAEMGFLADVRDRVLERFPSFPGVDPDVSARFVPAIGKGDVERHIAVSLCAGSMWHGVSLDRAVEIQLPWTPPFLWAVADWGTQQHTQKWLEDVALALHPRLAMQAMKVVRRELIARLPRTSRAAVGRISPVMVDGWPVRLVAEVPTGSVTVPFNVHWATTAKWLEDELIGACSSPDLAIDILEEL